MSILEEALKKLHQETKRFITAYGTSDNTDLQRTRSRIKVQLEDVRRAAVAVASANSMGKSFPMPNSQVVTPSLPKSESKMARRAQKNRSFTLPSITQKTKAESIVKVKDNNLIKGGENVVSADQKMSEAKGSAVSNRLPSIAAGSAVPLGSSSESKPEPHAKTSHTPKPKVMSSGIWSLTVEHFMSELSTSDSAREISLLYINECNTQAMDVLEKGLYQEAEQVYLLAAQSDVESLRELAYKYESRTAVLPSNPKNASRNASMLSPHSRQEEKRRSSTPPQPLQVEPSSVGLFTGRKKDPISGNGVLGNENFGCGNYKKMALDLRAFLALLQHDILRSVCQFYRVFEEDIYMDSESTTITSALTQIASVLESITKISRVETRKMPENDMDSGASLVFSGTVFIYEMCQYVLKQVHHEQRRRELQTDNSSSSLTQENFHQPTKVGRRKSSLQTEKAENNAPLNSKSKATSLCAQYIGSCIDLCEESSSVQLSTVTYLSWRVQLYEFLIGCYESQGQSLDALRVAYRCSTKTKELVDLEYLDPVPPPESWRRVLLTSLHQSTLSVLKQSWILVCASRSVQNSNNTDGATNSNKQQYATVAAAVEAALSPPLVISAIGGGSLAVSTPQVMPFPSLDQLREVPNRPQEMIQAAWDIICSVRLPNPSSIPKAIVNDNVSVEAETDSSPPSRKAGTAKGKRDAKKGKSPSQDEMAQKRQQEEAAKAKEEEKLFFSSNLENFQQQIVWFLVSLVRYAGKSSEKLSRKVSEKKSDASSKNSFAKGTIQWLRQCATEALQMILHEACSNFIGIRNPITEVEAAGERSVSLFSIFLSGSNLPFLVSKAELELALNEFNKAFLAAQDEKAKMVLGKQETVGKKAANPARGGVSGVKGSSKNLPPSDGNSNGVSASLQGLIIEEERFYLGLTLQQLFMSLIAAPYSQESSSYPLVRPNNSSAEMQALTQIIQVLQLLAVEAITSPVNVRANVNNGSINMNSIDICIFFLRISCCCLSLLTQGSTLDTPSCTESPSPLPGSAAAASAAANEKCETAIVPTEAVDSHDQKGDFSKRRYISSFSMKKEPVKHVSLVAGSGETAARKDLGRASEITIAMIRSMQHLCLAKYLGGYSVSDLVTAILDWTFISKLPKENNSNPTKSSEIDEKAPTPAGGNPSGNSNSQHPISPGIPAPLYRSKAIPNLPLKVSIWIASAQSLRSLSVILGGFSEAISTRLPVKPPLLLSTSPSSSSGPDVTSTQSLGYISTMERYVEAASVTILSEVHHILQARQNFLQAIMEGKGKDVLTAESLEGVGPRPVSAAQMANGISSRPGSTASAHSRVPSKEEREEEEQDAYYVVVLNTVEALLCCGRVQVDDLGTLALQVATRTQENIAEFNERYSANSSRVEGNVASIDGSMNPERSMELNKKKKRDTSKYYERGKTALALLNMALTMVSKRQQALAKSLGSARNPAELSNNESRHIRSVSGPVGIIDPSSNQIEGLGRGISLVTVSNLRSILSLRDTRTELTKSLVELRWQVALLRLQCASYQKHQDDIQILLTRQMNTKVYGVTTLKEQHILYDLMNEDPELPLTAEEEEKRLISWSQQHEGSPLLHALVLLTVVKLSQGKSKTKQRQKLEEAYEVLRKNSAKQLEEEAILANLFSQAIGSQSLSSSRQLKTVQKDKKAKRGDTSAIAELSVLSPLMIWGYAAIVSGELGIFSLANEAKKTLYRTFIEPSSVPSSEAESATCKSNTEPHSATTSASCESNWDLNKLELQPSNEALSQNSDLMLATLTKALLAIANAELEAAKAISRIGEEQDPPCASVSPSGARPNAKAEIQRSSLQSAYQIYFALQTSLSIDIRNSRWLHMANDSSSNKPGSLLEFASPLTLQCAKDLHMALLPSLSDSNCGARVIVPLAALCFTLRCLPPEMWSDVYVQLWALKVIKSLQLAWAHLLESPIRREKDGTKVKSPSSAMSASFMDKDLTQLCQDLLVRVFAHAWNQTLEHPNIRQRRYTKKLLKTSQLVMHAIYSGSIQEYMMKSRDEKADAPGAPGAKSTNANNKGKENSSFSDSIAKASEGANNSPSGIRIEGNEYIPDPKEDIPLYDVMPIEYLDLMEELIFSGPEFFHSLFANPAGSLSEASESRSKVATITTASTENFVPGQTEDFSSEGIVSALRLWLISPPSPQRIPSIIHDVANVLYSDFSTPANVVSERLQQFKEDILYPKVSVRVIEYYLKYEDTKSARLLGETALQTISEKWKRMQKCRDDYVVSMRNWLYDNGFVIADDSRGALNPTPALMNEKDDAKKAGKKTDSNDQVADKTAKSKDDKKQVGKGKDNSEAVDKSAAKVIALEAEERAFFYVERHWTLAEQQMLKQLTRAFLWLRHRRAARFVRSRFSQFSTPFVAQIHLYLAVAARKELEMESWQARKGALFGAAELQERSGSSGGSKTRRGNDGGSSGRGSARIQDDVAKATSQGKGEENNTKGALLCSSQKNAQYLRHALHAALLYNRIIYPARAFHAILIAAEAARNYICEKIPDTTLSDKELFDLLENDQSGSNDREASGLGDRETSFALDSAGANSGNPSSALPPEILAAMNSNSKIILRLMDQMIHVLDITRFGYCDHRRDTEILQPAAIKVGGATLYSSQIHFHGFVPSLLSYVSPVGQHEEKLNRRLGFTEALRDEKIKQQRLFICTMDEAITRKAVFDARFEEFRQILWSYSEIMPHLKESLMTLENQKQDLISSTEVSLQLPPLLARYGGNKKFNKKTHAEVIPPPSGHFIKRLGKDIPLDVFVDTFMYFSRCTQFISQKETINTALIINELTEGVFSEKILPHVLTIQHSIGAIDQSILRKYEVARRDAPRGLTLLSFARVSFERYELTEAYRRNFLRFARTLKPSVLVGRRAQAMEFPFSEVGSIAPTSQSFTDHLSVKSNSMFGDASSATGRPQNVKPVIASYQSAAEYFRENRDFSRLAECLCELGHIFLLHRSKSDAESCWLDAADASVGVPRVLSTWRQSIIPLSTSSLLNGMVLNEFFPRLLTTIEALSSLSMYVYREDQHRNIECLLLSACLVQKLFTCGVSAHFPQRMYDFGDFQIQDLVSLTPKKDVKFMGRIAHHILFVAHELVESSYFVYGSMMAALAEYLASHHVLSVEMTVEARLIRARAAAYSGNFNAAMRSIQTICFGERLPSPSWSNTPLVNERKSLQQCSTHNTASLLIDRKGKAAARDGNEAKRQLSTFGSPSNSRVTMIYDNNELPTSPYNTEAIAEFVACCLPNSTAEGTRNDGVNTVNSTNNNGPSSSKPTNVILKWLPDGAYELYGPLMCKRILLCIAEVLCSLSYREGSYVLLANYGGANTANIGSAGFRVGVATSRKRSPDRKRLSVSSGILIPPTRNSCTEAIAVAAQILEPFLSKENVASASTSAKKGPTRATAAAARSANDQRHNSPQSASGDETFEDGGDCFLRHRARLLSAIISSAQGTLQSSNRVLEAIIHEYNQRQEKENDASISSISGFQVCRLPDIPSFMLTLSHTYWCFSYLLLIRNYFSQRRYQLAADTTRQAVQLCDQVKDPYNSRFFSLYRAISLAKLGQLHEAQRVLEDVRLVSEALAVEAVDPLVAWIRLAQVVLCSEGRRSHPSPANSANLLDPVPNVFISEETVKALTTNAEFCGLLPWFLKDNSSCVIATLTSSQPSVWNAPIAIKLHTAINILAYSLLSRERKGSPVNYCVMERPKQTSPPANNDASRGMQLLYEAIGGISPQYDTSIHPTNLLESKFLLLRQRFSEINPVIEVPLKFKDTDMEHTMDSVGTIDSSVPVEGTTIGSISEFLSLLPTEEARSVVQQMISVISENVSVGIHDYDLLRKALLELAFFLFRIAPCNKISPALSMVASSCVILSFLVKQMQVNICSETSILSDYDFDERLLTDWASLDRDFPECLVAAIRASMPEIELAPKETTKSNATSGRRAPREGKNPPPVANSVPISVLANAFATLQREHKLYHVCSPVDSLDHETAIILLKRYLQDRSSTPNCAFFFYDRETRQTNLKLSLPTVKQKGAGGGNTPAARRGGANNAGSSFQQQQDMLLACSAFLPPMIMPIFSTELFTSAGPELLAAPRQNSVVAQSFSSWQRDKRRTGNNSNSVDDSTAQVKMVCIILAVSPINDPSLSHPPPPSELKKQSRAMASTPVPTSATVSPANPSSSRGRSSSRSGERPRSGLTPAPGSSSPSTGRGIHSATTDVNSFTSLDSSCPEWRCVCLELPQDSIKELHDQCTQVVRLMEKQNLVQGTHLYVNNAQNPAAPADSTADPALGPQSKVSQDLQDAVAILNAKTITFGSSIFTTNVNTASTVAAGSSGIPSTSTGKKNPAVNSQEFTTAVHPSIKGSGFTGSPALATCSFDYCELANVALQEQKDLLMERYKRRSNEIDEAKSSFMMNFLETLIRSYSIRAVADDSLMQAYVTELLPKCTLSLEILKEFFIPLLQATGEGSASRFYDPGFHEWMVRIETFAVKMLKPSRRSRIWGQI